MSNTWALCHPADDWQPLLSSHYLLATKFLGLNSINSQFINLFANVHSLLFRYVSLCSLLIKMLPLLQTSDCPNNWNRHESDRRLRNPVRQHRVLSPSFGVVAGGKLYRRKKFYSGKVDRRRVRSKLESWIQVIDILFCLGWFNDKLFATQSMSLVEITIFLENFGSNKANHRNRIFCIRYVFNSRVLF